MKIIKKTLLENLVDVSLEHLGGVAIKITEKSVGKCAVVGLYETEFPKELLKIEEAK